MHREMRRIDMRIVSQGKVSIHDDLLMGPLFATGESIHSRNLSFCNILFDKKTNFMISAGSVVYQIWLGREPP